eukprot:11338641-Alexandrium_andersonii.AAC.2
MTLTKAQPSAGIHSSGTRISKPQRTHARPQASSGGSSSGASAIGPVPSTRCRCRRPHPEGRRHPAPPTLEEAGSGVGPSGEMACGGPPGWAGGACSCRKSWIPPEFGGQ